MTKTDLAKAENSWRRLPHVVSLGAQKNFMNFAGHVGGQWDEDGLVFNEAYFRAAVAHLILFRATERLVSAQPWYSGGYRANVVTYTLAAFSRAISADSRGLALDVRSIWGSDGPSPSIERQLAEIAESCSRCHTDPPAGVKNVTEWAKREACWTAVRSLDMVLAPYVISEMVDANRVRTSEEGGNEPAEAGLRHRCTDEGCGAGTGVLGERSPVGLGQGLSHAYREFGMLDASNFANGIPTDFPVQEAPQTQGALEVEGLAPPPDER